MVVKLIELPTLELEGVRAELLENPALEEGVEETHLEEKLEWKTHRTIMKIMNMMH